MAVLHHTECGPTPNEHLDGASNKYLVSRKNYNAITIISLSKGCQF